MYAMFSAPSNGLDARALVDELRSRMRDELDYRLEAANLARSRAHFAGHPWVRIPEVVREPSSTGRVLTTEWVDGLNFSELHGRRAAGDEAAGGGGDLAIRLSTRCTASACSTATPTPGTTASTTTAA